MNLTLSNILTLLRLVCSPLVLPFLIITLLPFNQLWIHALLATLFIFFAATDFLDGFFARRWNQASDWGRVLDPIADKLLTCSTLIALLAINRIRAVWVLMLVCRELWVMGLREAALEQQLAIPVSWWGKLKTISQMCYLTLVLANPHYTQFTSSLFNFYELVLLATTLALSLWSAVQYQRKLFAQLTNR